MADKRLMERAEKQNILRVAQNYGIKPSENGYATCIHCKFSTPSMHFSEITNTYSCDYCQQGGDLVMFQDALDTAMNRQDYANRLTPMWDEQITGSHIEDTDYLVAPLIASGSPTILAAKAEKYKSFTALHIAYCVASGQKVFGYFPTKKGVVLYFDEENGLNEMKKRCRRIKQGLALKGNVGVGLVSNSGLLLDDDEWIAAFEEKIREYAPSLVILDVLPRFITYEEDRAKETKIFFQQNLLPLLKKYDIALLMLMHLKKGSPNSRYSSEDPIDQIRGSSELGNIAHSIMFQESNPKVTDTFIFRQEKNRNDRKVEPKSIRIEFDDPSGPIRMVCIGDAEDVLVAGATCAEEIMSWLAETGTTAFKTRDAREELEKRYSRDIIHQGLSILVRQRKLKRIKMGHYQIRTELKLQEFGGDN